MLIFIIINVKIPWYDKSWSYALEERWMSCNRFDAGKCFLPSHVWNKMRSYCIGMSPMSKEKYFMTFPSHVCISTFIKLPWSILQESPSWWLLNTFIGTRTCTREEFCWWRGACAAIWTSRWTIGRYWVGSVSIDTLRIQYFYRPLQKNYCCVIICHQINSFSI